MIFGSDGNLYGTTFFGGAGTGCFGGGCGTAFRLTPGGTKTILHSFEGDPGEGRGPVGTLAWDAGGNLYGVTSSGGIAGCASNEGCGTVFKLASDGAESVLHAFVDDGADGIQPMAGVVLDQRGNVYGTAYGGGAHGAGVVFKIAPDGTKTILHAFGGAGEGSNPNSLVLDNHGTLFGTTDAEDACLSNCGTVFTLIRFGGGYSVLHTFNPGSDGSAPQGGLTFDAAGNMYGTTRMGGTEDCSGIYGCGTVFKLTQAGVESVLYSFTPDGARGPGGGVIFDNRGNLLGTTLYGSDDGCHTGCGTVFMLAPDGTETVLQVLNRRQGIRPSTRLTRDHDGNFFGVAPHGAGATEFGTVFRVRE